MIRDEVREERRQRAVETLGIVESGHEARLDRVTRVARAVFGVPLSSVTVMDHERALFVGRAGFDDPESGRSDTPCSLVTDTGEIVTTDDARLDPRFAHLGAFNDNGLRFYVGHPLRDGSGNVVGSFCLMDAEPRQLSADEMAEFRDLAAWAQVELLADADASAARSTQQALLPAQPLEVEGVRVEGICLPSLSVGGDYYDYGLIGRFVHVAVGDVMGKGVGAAIIGSSVRAACRAASPQVAAGRELGLAVDRIERAVRTDLQRTGTFVTYFHAVLDLDTDELSFVDAGAGLSIIVRADGSVQHLAGTGLPLGLDEQQQHVTETTRLGVGDQLIVMSDGVLDVLDDEFDWALEVGRLATRPATGGADGAGGADGLGLLGSMAALTERRLSRDDVTVVVMDRRA
ncbi:GAF domain-containing SpoIIE family protein phosphatase [Frigoribacterium sp. ME-P-080]|uniref:GAF domain-containing SpoIIE family protein phosphatase n=1 Tax=Frigoribacterium sp. ME-P-080 TaxID=3040289 RepID=UPI00254E75B1|nr:GAF domain-containing SpoIIE family protein phosphatase [Frigoribacterium sp. ME-P-080]